jgi:prolyl oligopeptidase
VTAEWLEMGGVYVLANMRGGSEYGEAWHRAGMLANKQHVFDDFIAAAEWLVAHKYTSTAKLAIHGGSNGGLLMGAVENQRPDLFGAVLADVGVMDMLRFQKFTVGNAWIPEYGSSEASADQFKTLDAYSPYHNLKPGTKYPPTMIQTSDHDDRVFPAHSFKYAAEMQRDQAGSAPILLFVELKAGHGGGKPLQKVIDENADKYAFLSEALHFTPKFAAP